MKVRLIFFAFLFSNIVMVSGQHYVAFPTDSAIWRIDLYQNCSPNAPMPSESFQYTIDGDTSINSISYKKLVKSGISFCNMIAPYAGAFRDDTLARMVYFIHPDSLVESLLYDFNLQVGDTIRGYFDNGGAIVVGAIDTILLGGLQRKRMTLGNVVNQSPYFIEGIGNLSGLIEPYLDQLDFSFLLTCFSHNGLPVYPDSNSACMLIDDILETNVSEQILVAPNPFFYETTISCSNSLIDRIIVYNFLGEVLVSKSVENRSVIISLNEIDKGPLLCKIFLKNGQIKLTKLISIR